MLCIAINILLLEQRVTPLRTVHLLPVIFQRWGKTVVRLKVKTKSLFLGINYIESHYFRTKASNSTLNIEFFG